jgi:hypothetical protein
MSYARSDGLLGVRLTWLSEHAYLVVRTSAARTSGFFRHLARDLG